MGVVGAPKLRNQGILYVVQCLLRCQGLARRLRAITLCPSFVDRTLVVADADCLFPGMATLFATGTLAIDHSIVLAFSFVWAIQPYTYKLFAKH